MTTVRALCPPNPVAEAEMTVDRDDLGERQLHGWRQSAVVLLLRTTPSPRTSASYNTMPMPSRTPPWGCPGYREVDDWLQRLRGSTGGTAASSCFV